MFCPKCGCEFREGFTKCSDCGVELVPELPQEEPAEYRELTTVMTVTDEATLSAAKDALDSAGIDCLADGEETQHVFGGLGSDGVFTPLVGPVRLQVPEADAERAKEVLAELQTRAPLEEE